MSPDPQKPGPVPPKPGPPSSGGLTPPKAGLVSEAAKNQTAPIVLPGLPPPAKPAGPGERRPPGPAPAPQTPAAAAATAPKTIQLKRPSGALKVPQVSDEGGTPRTIRLARPGAVPPSPLTPAHASNVDEAAKNTTARIILDGPAPAKPKTGPGAGPALRRPATLKSPVVDEASKDKTSRIVLDLNAAPAKPTPDATQQKSSTRSVPGLAQASQEMLDEATKNKTTRIVLMDSDAPPSLKPKTGAASVVPPSLANADTVVAAPRGTGAKKSTTRVIDLASPEPGKRSTSRIILDDMEPAKPGDARRSTAPVSAGESGRAPAAGPKTIRLKRPTGAIMVPREPAPDDAPSTVKTIKLTKPGAAAAVPPTLVASATRPPPKETAKILVEDEGPAEPTPPAKHATSRITTEEDDSSQPETIRLRRPSTIVAVTPGGLQAPKPETARKTETTRIELLKTDEQVAPMTQRRTVKLRRPDLDKVKAGKDEDEGEAEEEGEEAGDKKPASLRPVDIIPGAGKRRREAEEEEEEGMHVAFCILSVVAVLVLGLVTYVLAAQAFAPDFTLPIPVSWI